MVKTVNWSHVFFCFLMMSCALQPLFLPNSEDTSHRISQKQNWAFERWHNGTGRLRQLPLTTVEQRFAQGFPGGIARFTDGDTIWVIRHLTEPTRMLHPAADCFRGLGYQVNSPKVLERNDGNHWRCFLANRGNQLQVCERIFDTENKQWTDVSAWYWETLFQPGKHEWWAVTQVNRSDSNNTLSL